MRIYVEKLESSESATLEMDGTGPELLGGLALICIGLHDRYNVDIAKLAKILPKIVNDEVLAIAQKQIFDLGAIEKMKGGGSDG